MSGMVLSLHIASQPSALDCTHKYYTFANFLVSVHSLVWFLESRSHFVAHTGVELILSFASTGIIVMNHHILFGFVCFVAGLGSREGLPIQPSY